MRSKPFARYVVVFAFFLFLALCVYWLSERSREHGPVFESEREQPPDEERGTDKEMRVAREDGREGDIGGIGDIERVLKIEDMKELVARGSHSHSLGLWRGRFEPEVSQWGVDEEGSRLRLSLPDGESVVLNLRQVEQFGDEREILSGKVEGREHSQVIVTRVNESVSGVIRMPELGVSWELRNRAEGMLEWEKVNLSELGVCGVCEDVR